MAEKDMLISSWEREFQTTLKVLKAFPAHRKDFKPHEKARSAKELAWTFVMEEKTGIAGALSGKIDFQTSPPPVEMKDVIAEYEKIHKESVAQLKKLSDQDLNSTMKFPVAPKTMGDLRRIDVIWATITDMIHHRGQFSVYLRMVDGKVPSIYGPSADEPWQ